MRTTLQRQRATVALIAVLTLSAAACKKNPVAGQPAPADPLRQIAVQCLNAAKALDASVDLKRALLKDGIITKEQSASLTPKLLNAVRLAREIKEGAETYSNFAEGKASLSALFRQLQNAFNDLSATFLPGLDARARERINAVLTVAGSALSFLNPLLGGS